MAFGLSAGAAALVGSVGSAAIGALGSSSASGAQSDAANRAAAQSQEQYDQTRKDLAPFRDNGVASSNQLSYLLGVGSPGGGTGKTADQWRSELQGQFTRPGELMYNPYENYESGVGWANGMRVPIGMSESTIDETGLNTAVQNAMGQQTAAAPTDANGKFGSLLKKYGIEDFQADPGYAFRQAEGQKGIERSAAARGGLFSGAAGKALARYNQDFASNEFNTAASRDTAYKNNVYNMLSGQAGLGQNAAAQTGNAGAQASAAYDNYTTQAANASAAGSTGIANAVNNGISQYQNYNLLNSILGAK